MRLILAALLMALPGMAMATTVLNSDSVLASGDVSLAYGMNVGSRVMVGGNFSGQSARIGTKLDASANGTTVLGVNGNIGGSSGSSENTSVSYGNIVYGGGNNTQSWGPLSAPSGTISQGTTSATADFKQAVDISNYLATLASTGTSSTSTDGSRVLTLSGTNSTNIYNISATDLINNQQLNIVGGISAIVNVVGSINSQTYLNFSTSLSASNIIFNFVDATTVDLNYSGGLPATILAPLANVIVRNTVMGDVIGKSVQANAPSIGLSGFSGDLAGYGASASEVASVPEPASWLVLITGFGLVGWAIRRSRRLPWLAKR